MGIYIGITALFIVIGTNVITWAAASRVSLRRAADSPYRGKKLTGDEWKETVGDALVATPAAAWFYWVGVLGIMALVYGLGLATGDLQNLVTEAASAEGTIEDAAESPESQELTEMLEQQRTCRSRLANRPDPTKNLYGFFMHDRSSEWRYGCEVQPDSRLNTLSSARLVEGLEEGAPETIGDSRGWEAGYIHETDRNFLALVKTRGRESDLTALSARLFGPTGTRGVQVESRIRYIILLALAENRADSEQVVGALEYTLEWRQGDNGEQCVAVRELARELLTAIRRRAAAERQSE